MSPRNNKRGPHAHQRRGVATMKLKSRALGALAGLLALVTFSGTAAGRRSRRTRRVRSSVVTSIRTEPGMFDDYMKYLAATYKQMMEEAKKAGHHPRLRRVQHAAARSGRPGHVPGRRPTRTWRRFDGLDDAHGCHLGEDASAAWSSGRARRIERGKMRTSLGSEMIRELDAEVAAGDGAKQKGPRLRALLFSVTRPRRPTVSRKRER